MINQNPYEPNLGDLLLSFRRKLMESARKDGLKHELTFSQVEILKFIGPNGKKTMRSIADHLKITPPSATTLVAEMEKKGLITRKNDTSDKRIVFITFTDKTKKLFSSICKRKELILKKMVSKLTQKDQESLARIIKIITAQ